MSSLFCNFEKFSQAIGDQADISILQQLYNSFLEGLKPEEQPIILAVGGGPGSGKTTWRREQNSRNFHIHDMDEVMIRLPGYQKDLNELGAKAAFEKWWPIAQKLARAIVQYAIANKYSIIYDRTCGTEGSYQDLLSAKKLGYKIHLIGLYASREVAKERLLDREKQEGRCVTGAILDEYRARFSALWPYYLEFVDEATLYDTTEGSWHLIFSSKEGVQEAAKYQIFLENGISFKDYFSKIITS
ncbi:MAG: zeta toxin family protein [Verrucomicrobia bacterium]|nr:zeta toxin family protein [Verrucomicrobiota bacterium]